MVIDLKYLFNETIKKHPSIKFDKKYGKLEIEILKVLVHKYEQQRLQTTLLNKKTNRQSYLHTKLDHPPSLKKSIAYSQILRVKRICSTYSEFECNCKVLQVQFTKIYYENLQLKFNLRRLNF